MFISQYFVSHLLSGLSFILMSLLFFVIAWSVNVGRYSNFGKCSIITPISVGFEAAASYWSAQFSVFFIGQHLDT